MYRGVSKRSRGYVRRKATQEMLSTCQIERVDKPVWDPGTNLVTAGDRSIIYTGVCRIWEVSGGSPLEVASDIVIVQSTNLSIPWDVDPVPRIDDELQILSSIVDEALVGKRYRIVSSSLAGDLRATRRFNIQGIEDRT